MLYYSYKEWILKISFKIKPLKEYSKYVPAFAFEYVVIFCGAGSTIEECTRNKLAILQVL